jgi:hypothetical protein
LGICWRPANKNRARKQALFTDSKWRLIENNAGAAADLTKKVSRQFDHLLLIVSFDAVFDNFQDLLHCIPQ